MRVLILGVFMLNAECCYDESQYAECRYNEHHTKCHYTECHYAGCHSASKDPNVFQFLKLKR